MVIEVIFLNNKFVVLILTIFAVSLTAVNIYASEDTIRVGLEQKFKNVSTINFGDTTIEISDDDNKYYTITSVAGFVCKPVSGTYMDCGESFSTYNKAISYAGSSKYSATPALVEGKWRVYIYGFEANQIEDILDEDDFSIVSLSPKAVSFSVNGITTAVINSDKAYAKNTEDITTIGGVKYRGTIELAVNNSLITAINVINVEDYLLSVVPSEMPSSWNEEALKAQAIAARNYAYKNKGKHDSYDLCDNTDCQQYNGYSAEKDTTTTAVEQTEGELAYYEGELIDTMYFSSSGGHTISSKYAWGTGVPYLVGVSEINEVGAKEWERTFTFDELTALCNKKGFNIGSVTNVYISETVDGGNVNKLTFEGSLGTKVIENDVVRTFFSGSSGGSLNSRNFVISNSTTTTSKNDVVYAVSKEGVQKLDSTTVYAVGKGGEVVTTKVSGLVSTTTKATVSGTAVTLVGKGWGHGIGMSQYGAKGMADKGYSYKQILKHYYTGIDIK